jgi:catechol 2,3-dioxygenase-like lactoylglutathione lyase family enzyme
MPILRGVRCVEFEFCDPERAADFFSDIWNLTEVVRHKGSIYFRGTAGYHSIFVARPAESGTAVRRIVFDARNRSDVQAFYERVKSASEFVEKPHALTGPESGWGFGFADFEGRNYAIVCDVQDHSAAADEIDRPRKIAHVNINALDVDKSRRYLIDVLGFKLIDQSGPLSFLHCDNTDHSSLVVCNASKPTLNHIAFELPFLESVMRGAGRMREAGYPLEWGIGRHGAGNNVFGYFAGPEEIPLEYTAEVLQIDDSYVPHGPEHWRFPPGRMDQWGITAPHTPRWKRIQDMHRFRSGAYQL